MRIEIFLAIILSNLTLIQCIFAQENSDIDWYQNISTKDFVQRDGKCFAKRLVTDTFELTAGVYPIYSGDELEEGVEVIIKEIEIVPSTSEWVKKKADKNCVSANPEDCLVWCLMETPGVTQELKILMDTIQSKNYIMKELSKEKLERKGRFVTWKEVVCEEDISNELIKEVKESLKTNGYYKGRNNAKLNTKLKKYLTNFQRENNLPTGYLDFETLNYLGINLR